jgi:hypothetical protein
LSLAKECVINKLDLLTNVTVVNDAIRFVSQKSEEKLKSFSSSNQDSKEESGESDYDEHKQGEEEEEDGIGEMTISTTKEIF